MDVILIEPASVRTPLWEKMGDIDTEYLEDTEYAPVLRKLKTTALAGVQRGLPTSAVAAAVIRALTAKRPPARILVAKRRLRRRLMRLVPSRLVDRLIVRGMLGR